jgi:16S rRNA (guanine(966)-N(2))-methyltransferase RsmD
VIPALKGRRLKSPTWDGLRPTSDKLRETLFNILAPRLDGARVLDGYAGTGALGIEAISRGAAWVMFVDNDRRAEALVADNLAHCGVSGGYAIIRATVAVAIDDLGAAPAHPFDIILLDPPYDDPQVDAVIAAGGDALAPAGVLVLEHRRRQAVPEAAGRLVRVRQVTVATRRCRCIHVHSRLPGVVRSADERPRRHHARRPALRSHHRRHPRERGEAPCSRGGGSIARVVFKDQPNVEVDTFNGLLVDYVGASAQVIVRGCARCPTRVRGSDGAHEPAPEPTH